MASPFKFFRRHQKVMIAVLGIGAIIAFVFLDPRIMDTLVHLLGGGAKQQVPVRTTKFGNLTESQLAGLLALGKTGIRELLAAQEKALAQG